MTGMRPAADPATGPGEPGPGAVGAGPPVTVSRWSRTATGFTGVAAVAVVILAAVPYFAGGPAEAPLITLLTFVAMASMWNLLAGYAGLVSVGQQAFVGLGAYFVLILAINGASPFAALPVAAVGCGVVALPLWWLVSRLRSGYFAIATWVLAATIMLIIERFSSGFDPLRSAAPAERSRKQKGRPEEPGVLGFSASGSVSGRRARS